MCPGACSTRTLEAGQVEQVLVGEGHDVLGLAPGRAGAELLLEHGDQGGVQQRERVLQAVAVVAVEVGGDRRGAAHRRDRVDVVEVAVGQQHRGGLEAVLAQHLGELLLHPDARVDDEALLPGAGREHVAVGGEGGGREPDREHDGEPNVHRHDAGHRCRAGSGTRGDTQPTTGVPHGRRA